MFTVFLLEQKLKAEADCKNKHKACDCVKRTLTLPCFLQKGCCGRENVYTRPNIRGSVVMLLAAIHTRTTAVIALSMSE
jgi:hypothetical protein